MISLYKTIAYTKKWRHVLWMALIVGAILPLLLILLEPFDNSNQFDYKYALLSGYALCISIPILGLHLLENYVYKKQGNRWYVLNEFIYSILALFVIFIFSFFYHFYIVGGDSVLDTSALWGFVKSFCLPFTPFIVPLWLYLRSKFGVIEVPNQEAENIKKKRIVTITGENKSETMMMNESDFIYAHSQQNYVDVYFNTKEGIEQKVFRSTLANMMKQLPNAWQVHRSYLVNLDYLQTVEGNARKRFMTISKTEKNIPISQKYYVALQKRLSNSSLNTNK